MPIPDGRCRNIHGEQEVKGHPRWLGYSAAALISGALVLYLLNNREALASIRSISFGFVVALVLAALLASLLNGVQFKYAARAFGLPLTMREWYGLAVTNTMLNYVVPFKGAVLVRAAYMKRHYSFSYTSYASLTASSQLITIVVAAATAAVTTLSLVESLQGRNEALMVAGVALGAALVGYALVVRSESNRWTHSRTGGLISRFAEGFSRWRTDKRSLLAFSTATFAWIVMQGMRLWVAFTALGVSVGFAEIVVIQAIVAMSLVVSITPGNLGVKEGVTALLASFAGIDPAVALLASLVDRAAGLLVTIPIGIVFSRDLYSKGSS